MVRKSKGRQKLEMVKISNESNLKVTFCKRRSGLFKKASELCILCGAKIAIIVFSTKNKVYSFGHPCVESVVNQFITRNAPESNGTLERFEACHNFNAHELSTQLTQVLNELEAEEKRGEELSQMRKASQSQYWWEPTVDKLNPPQLEHLKLKLEDLKKTIARQTENIIIQSSTVPQEFAGSSSVGGIIQFDPNNTDINSPNKNMMPSLPSPMIQSFTVPQHFPENSSNETSLAFDPTNTFFNDPITNMTPPHPPTYQPHRPLLYNSPLYHTHPHLDQRFNFKFD